MPHTNRNKPELFEDWFAPIISKDGSVDTCLSAVEDDLKKKLAFVANLKKKLTHQSGKKIDRITHISKKLSSLESTLEHRKEVLIPDREAAWFRENTTHNLGPFSSKILPNPFFFKYERFQVQEIKSTIRTSWRIGKGRYTHHKDQNLWNMLLELNCELKSIARLDSPFEAIRLDLEDQHLLDTLQSPLLKKFLNNVAKEYKVVRARLDSCYEELFKLSEKLWNWQIDENRKSGRSQSAKSAREQFKERRNSNSFTPREFFTTKDHQAMKFLGLTELPSENSLKKRYLEMAKELHPDSKKGNETSFKLLSDAYGHLQKKIRQRPRVRL